MTVECFCPIGQALLDNNRTCARKFYSNHHHHHHHRLRVSFEHFAISAIDECTEGTDHCLTATGARCVDREVLYTCECNTGFLLNQDQISCRGRI